MCDEFKILLQKVRCEFCRSAKLKAFCKILEGGLSNYAQQRAMDFYLISSVRLSSTSGDIVGCEVLAAQLESNVITPVAS